MYQFKTNHLEKFKAKMATIFDLKLNSDDSDSDYSESESSNDEKSKSKKSKREKRLKLEERKRLKEESERKERVASLYASMLSESDVNHRHEQSVPRDDFMLQFHKRWDSGGKRNIEISELEKYIDISTSKVVESNGVMNIGDFKDKCRSTPDVEQLDGIKKAVTEMKKEGKDVVKKTYTFAGQTFEVFNKIDKQSKSYKNLRKKQDQKLGGNFAFIDDMISSKTNWAMHNTIHHYRLGFSTHSVCNKEV